MEYIEKALQNKSSTSRKKLDQGLEEVVKGIQSLKVGENTNTRLQIPSLYNFSGQSRTIIEQGDSSQDNLMGRFLRQANKYGTKLTEIIDPELDYEKFTINGLEILEPEKIYEKKILERKNNFIRSIRENEVQCLGNDTS